MGRRVSSEDASVALQSVGPSKAPMSRGASGTRKTETRFRDLLSSCLLGLLLRPEALFRLKETHRNRLLRSLDSVVSSIESLILALEAVSRPPAYVQSWNAVTQAQKLLSTASGEGSSPLSLEMAKKKSLEAAELLKRNFLGELPTAEEGRKILATEEAALAPQMVVLQEGLQRLGSASGVDVRQIQQLLLPSLSQDLSDVMTEVLRKVDDGTILEDPSSRISELVAVPSVINMVERARSPMDPLVQPKDRTRQLEGPFPAGSSLALRQATPVAPATITTTRTPGDLPVDATIIYAPDGDASRTVTLLGSGRNRLVSRPLGTPTYSITVDHLLVNFADVLYSLPLTLGARTPAQIKADLEAAVIPINQDLRVEVLVEPQRTHLYLISSGEITLSASGQAASPPAILSAVLGPFPLALAGQLLKVDASALGQSNVTSHLFGAGPFASMQDVIDDLEADVAFSGSMLYAEVGGMLQITYNAPGYNTLTATLVPALLGFAVDEVEVGMVAVGDSAAESLGFDPSQASLSEYTAAEVVALLRDDVLMDAAATSSAVVEGTGAFAMTGPTLLFIAMDQDFSSTGTNIGDYCVVTGLGYLRVLAVGTTDLELDVVGPPLGIGISFEVIAERILLESYSEELTSSIEIGAGTANAGLGLVAGVTGPATTDYEVYGTLEGEGAPRVVDKAVLGIPESAQVQMADSTVTSSSLRQFRELQRNLRSVTSHAYFQYLVGGVELLESVNEASRLTGLRSHRVQDVQKKLAALLTLLDPDSPQRTLVLRALERMGVAPPAVPATTLKASMLAYVPAVDAEDASVADDTVRGLRDHGYDRAAEFVLEARLSELEGLTGETASKAGRVTAALSDVSRRLQDRSARRT